MENIQISEHPKTYNHLHAIKKNKYMILARQERKEQVARDVKQTEEKEVPNVKEK